MFIEMSYPISTDIPVFPGSPKEKFIPYMRISKGDICNSTVLHHFLHNGTHIDSPYHFYSQGKTIDQIPIENFCYTKPLIIHKKLTMGGLIQPEDLKVYGASLYKADILMLCTGYYSLRHNRDDYTNDFPALSLGAAKLIREELLNLKAIAIDSLSIESSKLGPVQNNIVHKTLLAGDIYTTRPVLVFEDVNIGVILEKKVIRILAFPIRLTGMDAAPVSMVAEVL
jgi:arylformamidase